MRVAIVNDLSIAQEILRRAIAQMPGAVVAWVAADGAQALARCRVDRPDLILMDMVMPVMDGAVATRAIMHECPCPILVVTSTIEGHLGLVYEALSAGAIDAVHTPTLGVAGAISGADALASKARVAVAASAHAPAPSVRPQTVVQATREVRRGTLPVVAIGASTGGPHAVATVLRGLTDASPHVACAIVQHIDVAYTEGLAQWLTHETGRRVRTARDGESFTLGDTVLASTREHLVAERGLVRYRTAPDDALHRPSIDVFFESLARDDTVLGVAILLTGMGRDGASGLRSMRDAGWHTIAQDEATSVVWGMPGAAVAFGAACEVLALESIGAAAARIVASSAAAPRKA